jgi:hypothetical protein
MEDLNNIDQRIRDFEKNNIQKSSTTPEGYFDSFQNKVHQRVYDQPKSAPWMKRISMAALAVVIVFFSIKVIRSNIDSDGKTIEAEDVATYYQENIDLLSLEDVYEVASDEMIDALASEIRTEYNQTTIKETETPGLEDITEEEIIEYLLEEETLDWEYL